MASSCDSCVPSPFLFFMSERMSLSFREAPVPRLCCFTLGARAKATLRDIWRCSVFARASNAFVILTWPPSTLRLKAWRQSVRMTKVKQRLWNLCVIIDRTYKFLILVFSVICPVNYSDTKIGDSDQELTDDWRERYRFNACQSSGRFAQLLVSKFVSPGGGHIVAIAFSWYFWRPPLHSLIRLEILRMPAALNLMSMWRQVL